MLLPFFPTNGGPSNPLHTTEPPLLPKDPTLPTLLKTSFLRTSYSLVEFLPPVPGPPTPTFLLSHTSRDFVLPYPLSKFHVVLVHRTPVSQSLHLDFFLGPWVSSPCKIWETLLLR